MDAAWSQMIAAMQASGRQGVLAITGGGTGAIAELLRVPGGSRLLLEAIVPYNSGSLRDYLGADPEQACSGESAVVMAERARTRAAALAKPDAVPIGLGATASLASDRPKPRPALAFEFTPEGDPGASSVWNRSRSAAKVPGTSRVSSTVSPVFTDSG